ncbi:hypothetical protein BC940DRAFT_83381 [Gongronella butleri]|nr:hypothetical protein BC940DRAFT_83381 [Gongronella butleri]
MQEFLARNMSDTLYGYIGTSNCGTGGKSALFADSKRRYAGNAVSSEGGKLKQLLSSSDKNKKPSVFSDAEGSFSYSPAFKDVPPPGYEPRLRRSRSNDDVYAANAAAGGFLLYPPVLFAPTISFCGAFGAVAGGTGGGGASAVCGAGNNAGYAFGPATGNSGAGSNFTCGGGGSGGVGC